MFFGGQNLCPAERWRGHLCPRTHIKPNCTRLTSDGLDLTFPIEHFVCGDETLTKIWSHAFLVHAFLVGKHYTFWGVPQFRQSHPKPRADKWFTLFQPLKHLGTCKIQVVSDSPLLCRFVYYSILKNWIIFNSTDHIKKIYFIVRKKIYFRRISIRPIYLRKMSHGSLFIDNGYQMASFLHILDIWWKRHNSLHPFPDWLKTISLKSERLTIRENNVGIIQNQHKLSALQCLEYTLSKHHV